MTPESSFSVVVLPAPLGPRKATNSPCSTGQVDAADRLDRAILPAEQPADRGRKPFLLLIDAVGLRQSFDLDDGHKPHYKLPGGEGKDQARGVFPRRGVRLIIAPRSWSFLVPTLRVGTHLLRRSASATSDAERRGRCVPTEDRGNEDSVWF